MGSGNSRLGGSGHPPSARTHHPQRRRPSIKRNLSSFLICGASSSHPHNEMEDDPAELFVNSVKHSAAEKIRFPSKSSILSTEPRVVNSLLSEKEICYNDNQSREDFSRISEAKERVECLSKKKGLHSSSQLMDNPTSNELTGMSSHNELSLDPVIVDRTANADVVDNGKGKVNEIAQSDAVESSYDEMTPENEVMIFRECDFTSGSAPSESSLDCTLHASSSGLGSSDMEEDHRNENDLQIDRASGPTNILFSNNSSGGLTSHEARHSNRRLFWDSFSRRNLRRNANSGNLLLGSDDVGGFGFHDRSRLDLSCDIFDYEVGGYSRLHRANEQRWRANSEVWERSHDLDSGSDSRMNFCPSGIHPDGTCLCGSILTTEESGTPASISRIVMLAEALFEVLDEVHRQPLSMSLSTLSVPAPESIVDSLPVKNYCQLRRTEDKDEFTQCYICLAEYEDGDKIRVLPCHHEFHVSCVDKWLKEIHGVCPLCRGDVREGTSRGSISS